MAQVDLRHTATANRILQSIGNLSIGNQGHTSFDSLTLDPATGITQGHLTILSKHSWGSINVPHPTLENPLGVRSVEIAAQRTFPCDFQYSPTGNKISGHVTIQSFKLETSIAGQNYSIDFGSITLDLNRIERILEGDYSVLVEIIPGPPGLVTQTRNEYDQIKASYAAKYGLGNVYFASHSFVDWASPERLGDWFVEAFTTGGAALALAMQQVETQALQQLQQVIAFLEAKIVGQAHSIASKVLTGQQVIWPNIALKLIWQTVKYESRRAVANVPITPWLPVRHGAFVLVWTSSAITPPFTSTSSPHYPAINVTFTNATNQAVSFFLNGGHGLNTTLTPHQTISYLVAVDAGTVPAITIHQNVGPPLGFSLADQGKYHFEIQSGKIVNAFS